MRIINKIIFGIFDWMAGGNYIPYGKEKPTTKKMIVIAVILGIIYAIGWVITIYGLFIN